MPIHPEDQLELGRALLSAPEAGEREHRAAIRFAFDAVCHRVALHFGLDPATFAGSERQVRELVWANSQPDDPAFLRLARRHWNTLWLAALRAQRSLDERVDALEAGTCLVLAESILTARVKALQ